MELVEAGGRAAQDAVQAASRQGGQAGEGGGLEGWGRMGQVWGRVDGMGLAEGGRASRSRDLNRTACVGSE